MLLTSTMDTRGKLAFVAALAVLPFLSGCSLLPTAVAPTPTPTVEPAPPSVEGFWLVTRTVVASDTTEADFAIGTVETRYQRFDNIECDGEVCTGNVASVLAMEDFDTLDPDVEPIPFTQTGDKLEYQFDSKSDCVSNATGEVLVAEGFLFSRTFDLTISDSDDVVALAIDGTSNYLFGPTDEAVALQCEGYGDIDYEVVMVPIE